MFQLRYAALSLIFLCPTPLLGQATVPPVAPLPSPEQALEGFDAVVEDALKAWKAPGVAISVVRDGKVVLSKGYGVRDPATGLPMSKDTIFPIGSMSKAFTSFGIGLAVDEGKMNLDVPATTYLPELRLQDVVASRELTLRDMLSHRSGLPRHDMVWIENRNISREDLLPRIPHLAPSAPFRTLFQYNNIMFTLAGLAIDRVSGTKWETYTQERILDPLGMTRSTTFPDVAFRDPNHVGASQAHGTGSVNLPLFRSHPVMAPAGGVYSTVEDLTRWMSMLLAKGKHDGKQIIQPATVAQLFRPNSFTTRLETLPSVTTSSYGLAWLNGTFRGHQTIWHDGGLPGITTVVTLLPTSNIGVTVLVNQAPTELPYMLTRALLDRLLGFERVDWIGGAAKRKQTRDAQTALEVANAGAERVAGTKPSHKLADYAGTYLNKGYGPIKVRLEGGKLVAEYNEGTSPLSHFHYDVFKAMSEDEMNVLLDSRFNFQTDTEGRIASISSPMEPSLPPILFEKQPDDRLGQPAYLASLAGTYTTKAGKVVFSVSGDTLQMQPADGPALKLVPGIDGEYTHPQRRDIRIRFEEDKTGRITGYRMLDSTGLTQAKKS